MIVILFTGGTISMRTDAGMGAVPTLSGRDILALASGVERIAPVEIDDWGSYPGPHMSPDRMWALRSRVLHHLGREEVQGVVITHGTDSLEETAYLLARSTDGEKPVVVTGAMRTSSDLGWDGPANIGASVRVAASSEARNAGVLVVISDRIFSALDVTKTHTQMVEAFESPGLGPLGVVDETRVVFRRATRGADGTLAPEKLGGPVDIVSAYPGGDSRLLDASREAGGAGVVLVGMGRGNVPPEMVPGIERWLDAGKPVVITSRAVRGRVGPTYGYEGGGRKLWDRGVMFAVGRRPQQARIELMLALGLGMSAADMRRVFEAEPG